MVVAYRLLTIHLCGVVLLLFSSVMSLFHDLIHGSTAMNPVKTLMKEQPVFARAWGKALASKREKPLIRCENCTKTPEDIRDVIQCMLCSVCKTKLQFKVHYCSAYVSLKFYPTPTHYGKQPVSKNLKAPRRTHFENSRTCHITCASPRHRMAVSLSERQVWAPPPPQPRTPPLSSDRSRSSPPTNRLTTSYSTPTTAPCASWPLPVR
jgi:hypothetical protein